MCEAEGSVVDWGFREASMTTHSSSGGVGSPQGLASIIVEVLGKVASPEASSKVIQRALGLARLAKMPGDPVVLLAFASGALRDAAGTAFGEETAEELLGDLRPILERAAAHAIAVEADEDEAARQATADDLPVDSLLEPRGKAERAERADRAAKAEKADRAATTEKAERADRAATAEKADRAAKADDGKPKKRRTLTQGKAATLNKRPSGTLAAGAPKRGSRRTGQDPRRTTLPYQSAVENPTEGQDAGLPLVVVVDPDEALRTTLARMLRREGCGVVTAPDAELGLALCERVLPRLVIADLAMEQMAVTLHRRFATRCPPVVIFTPGGWAPTEVKGADRVMPKPVTPERLLSILETFLPDRPSR